MARIKYTYDTQTCRYERVKRTWMDVFLNFAGYLATAAVVATFVVLIRNAYYETPQTRSLTRENESLREHHENLRAELFEVSSVIDALNQRNNNIYRKIYEAEPLQNGASTTRSNFSKHYKTILQNGWDNEDYVEDAVDKIEKIRKASSKRSMEEVIRLARDNSEILTSLPAIQPVENKDLKKLASGFGMRINPFHKARVMHFGIDFATHRGDNVLATGDGRVKLVKSNSKLETGYGNYIEIDHGNGYVTRYAHLGEIEVGQGDRVKRGDTIAKAGNSGGSIAPHVHYEIIKDGNQIDPLNFMIQGLDDHMFRTLRQVAGRENQSLD
ncbi:M23 family metallopeptidase [Fulvivirga sedimenti]|uniref:M23 family metallopeptidase n=1 Tax=Fulvivirga sedimenti TaxID=2879465 RepID=A0A9X1HWC3_9BACT|nr:M23 family metallopeptidase [Fulvivirga sedimenti]MCA6079140.1 M23 family metallopeptidase [Fulvivirga sedimenti]